jgi:hypothetical protein
MRKNHKKSMRGRQNSGRGEVAWLAYGPVEPGARVQIPAPAFQRILHRERADLAFPALPAKSRVSIMPVVFLGIHVYLIQIFQCPSAIKLIVLEFLYELGVA